MEIEANRFAAALLMPESFLMHDIGQAKDYDIDDERPNDALARKLQVSRQALEFRISSLLQTKSSFRQSS